MTGSFPLLLLAALLVATVGLQPADPCEPALTAWEISRVCAAGRPTAQCCDRVVAVVELGGGVPCFCRVAAEPELATLNFKRVLTSCGGARLTAACEGADHRSRAVVKAAPLPRRKLVGAPVRSSNGTCPSATAWATSVAVACSQSITDQGPCCAALDKAIPMSKSNVVECICTLESAPPIQEVRLQARHLIKDFASCMSMRPGDVHFPSDGCASVPPKTMGTPPPAAASPAVGNLSPPAAASPSLTSAHPSRERDSTPAPSKSKDHAILVGILVTMVVFGGLVCIGAGGYAIYKYKGGGWVLLGRARANEQQPNIFIINNNYNNNNNAAARPEVSTQPEASTSSSTSDAALSTVVNNVMRHTAELQKELRRSGRLAGEDPTHAGLQFRR